MKPIPSFWELEHPVLEHDCLRVHIERRTFCFDRWDTGNTGLALSLHTLTAQLLRRRYEKLEMSTSLGELNLHTNVTGILFGRKYPNTFESVTI